MRSFRLSIIPLVLIVALVSLQPGRGYYQSLDQTGTLWSPYLEWSLTNASFSGNPFDLVANVTFVHNTSSESHTTEMFYTGNNVWKFRFTGTRTGIWTFTTQSSDPDLNGKTGTVTINPNPNPAVTGFLTSVGNRFAVQTGENGETKGFLLNIYQNQIETNGATGSIFLDGVLSFKDPNRLNAYLQQARDNGFKMVFFAPVDDRVWTDGTNPRFALFDALDFIISESHRQGMAVHLWLWGDSERGWTPPGGINSAADKRLQRYIAARLGPLPNWTMGYGFDLGEWVTDAQLSEWAAYMHAHMGWKHLLSARGFALNELDIISYSSNGPGSPAGSLQTSPNGPSSFDEVVQDLDSNLNKPHFYEERFYYQRDMTGGQTWTMDRTRQSLWWYTMAGGVGAIWGQRSPDEPYPNPEQLRTFSRFWQDRYLLSVQRANLGSAMVLKTAANDNYVFYQENTNTIVMDLSGMAGTQRAVAVDTKKEYAELDLGLLQAINQTWKAPYTSDWAIAVGNFNSDVIEPPPVTPTSAATPTQPTMSTATPIPPTAVPTAQTFTPIPTDVSNTPTTQPPPDTVTVIVNPLPATPKVGGTVAVAIELANAVELYGLEVRCVVSPLVLVGTAASGGDGFNNTNSFLLDKGFSSTDGSWIVAASRLRPNPALNGSVTAFYLNYTIRSIASTDFSCTAAAADVNGKTIPVTISNRFGRAAALPTTEPANTPESLIIMPTNIPTEVVMPTLPPTLAQPESSTISGTVAYQSAPDNAGVTVELLSVDKTPLASVVTNTSGAYSFTDVPVGVYYLSVSAPLHLPLLRTVKVETGGQVIEMNVDTLSGGDTDGNQVIDLLDASLIGANYGLAVPPAPANADINRDGLADLRDLVIVSGNIGLAGTTSVP